MESESKFVILGTSFYRLLQLLEFDLSTEFQDTGKYVWLVEYFKYMTAVLVKPNVTGHLPDIIIYLHSDCATGAGIVENVELNLSL